MICQVKNKESRGLLKSIKIALIQREWTIEDLAREVGEYSVGYIKAIIYGYRRGSGGTRGRKSDAKRKILEVLGIE